MKKKIIFAFKQFRTEKGKIEIFDWKEEIRLLEFPLVTNYKSNEYGIQIICIMQIDSSKQYEKLDFIDFLAQMRNGTIFIIQYKIDTNTLEVKLMINTGVETFTKFLILNSQEKSIYDILYCSNNEDELLLCKLNRELKIDGNSEYSILKEDKINLISIEECDDNEDKKQSGLIQIIETEEFFPYILIAQENSSK